MEDSRTEAIQRRQKRRASDANHNEPPPKRRASNESGSSPRVLRSAKPNNKQKANPEAKVSRKEQKRRKKGGKKVEDLPKTYTDHPEPRDALADDLSDAKLKKLAIRHLRKNPSFSLKDALLRIRTTCGKKVINKVETAIKNFGMDHGPDWDESERILQRKQDKKMRNANKKKPESKSDNARATKRARARLETDLKRARDRAEARGDSPSSDGGVSVGDTPGSTPEVHMTGGSEMDESSDSASVGEKPPAEIDHVPTFYPSVPQSQIANGIPVPPPPSELAPPPPPPTPPLPPPPPEGTSTDLRLYQCPPDEQQLQTRYFGTTDPGAIVTCLRCAQPGHISQTCPNRTCHHCGTRDLHLPIHCPRNRKCARCRQRGHVSRHCTNPTKIPNSLADACEICLIIGHVEEQCPYLGRMVRPDRVVTRKIPRDRMIVACYRCGSDRHWGDDCSLEKVNASRAQGILREWSREYAAFFLQAEEDQGRQNGMQVGNGGVGETRGASVPQYQLAQLGDWT